MSDDFDSSEVCRDEECDIEELHRPHKRLRTRRVVVHHRPRSKRPLWQQDAPDALCESVLKACSQPMMASWITREVRDDYGPVTDRTVYRWVRKLVKEAELVKLDLGLAFSTYVRARSRLLTDREALREYMVANADCLPSCTKESVA